MQIQWKHAFLKENWWNNLETPLFVRGPPPPFQLTPLFLSNFFMAPLFAQISKTRNPPPPPLILGGRKGNYDCLQCFEFWNSVWNFNRLINILSYLIDSQITLALVDVNVFFSSLSLFVYVFKGRPWNTFLSGELDVFLTAI